MDQSIDIDLLKSASLFTGFTDAELAVITQMATIQTFDAGDVVFQEGDTLTYLYLIQSGEVLIKKSSKAKLKQHALGRLKAGAVLGETQFLEGSPVVATVLASKNTTLLAFKITELTLLMTKPNHFDNSSHVNNEALYNKLITNTARILSQRLTWSLSTLSTSLENEIELNHKTRFIVNFFISVLIALLLYMCAMNILAEYASTMVSSTFATSAFLSVIFFQFIYFIKTSRMPLAFFGFTTKNWLKVSFESIGYSILIIVGLIIFKLCLIQFIPLYHHELLFNPRDGLNMEYGHIIQTSHLFYLAMIYAAFCVFQEFVSRGLLQGCIGFFHQGKHKNLVAILLSNIIFSILHLHVSFIFALVVFPLGCFWGWLYSKSKSLVGVSISHVLIGVTAGNFIGFNFLLLHL
jgi:CRP-like cAMP-binding protein/membrane protease YdiL (CAAX protease family)